MAWNWGVSVITFAFGLGFGVALAYFLLPRGSRIQELEQELETSKASLNEYRGKVSQHFQKTAELFDDMTDRYRAVYQHMATSAQALCEDQPPALQLDIVDHRRLASGDSTDEATKNPPSADADQDTEMDLESRDEVKETKAGNLDSDDEYLGDAPRVPELGDVDKAAGSTEPPSGTRH